MTRFFLCAILAVAVLLAQRTLPKVIHKQEPKYSEEARVAKHEGTVLLSLVVDREGVPTQIQVVRPLGLGLDEKAVEAVTQWRFEPATENGKAVEAKARVEISFRLDGKPKSDQRQ